MLIRCLRVVATLTCLISFLIPPDAASAQSLTEFPIPTANSMPTSIIAGPDGNLWFTETNGNKIGRITTSGTITEFPIPTSNSGLSSIATGLDGALWFTEGNGNKIGRITTAGAITEFVVPAVQSMPASIAAGSDGAMWFAETENFGIGRIAPGGTLAEFPVPDGGVIGVTGGSDGRLWVTIFVRKIDAVDPNLVQTASGGITSFILPSNAIGFAGIVSGPDGALWFLESVFPTSAGVSNRIGRLTTSGMASEVQTPTFQSDPAGIAVGPDGALWFTENTPFHANLGRITTTGTITEMVLPSSNPAPGLGGIATGPDGALWVVEFANKIGRFVPPPSANTLFSAVLPSSRSVAVGARATAFATLINADSATAISCQLAPITTVPAVFSFQTTDPKTNALTGSPNTPVDIPAGGTQTFLVSFTANAPFTPTDVAVGSSCANEAAAAISSGVNTLLLSGSASPVPDIVALAASGDPGVVDIPGANGTGDFAVATVNVGASGMITASADTGGVTLPVTIALCETDPETGACTSAMGSSVSTTINSNATPTFGIFVADNGTVPFSPAVNRIFVRFKDQNGMTRGSTSVAVRTQ